ncbi:hydantoinase B/oxoprolinase family protein [Streptomyces mexicanus]|uniref:Hydantoinase B/oxoprolinase family protein n=1 Tax=Streptomyces mexicanus TaxID=178566 RepID=A0A7X1HXH3_9ACTN|nr:hydantoinase B/oxoprolinase family protein [Streptomyces mexicanus]MBC2864990.1 hydantoinase B/oxoprolinase family protein [Streptomyces mexicanus]
MTTVDPMPEYDPIEIEILRSRTQAITDEAADTVYRTAISPVVTEGRDFSTTLLDADGNLVVGGGFISLHWLAATRAARSIMDRFQDSVADGDVFLVNDPYNGGGLHPSDIFICRPIYAAGERIAWICMSAHMLDIGGLAVGSFAPAATECFQEGLRIPPVRLFAAGQECADIWNLVTTNVRMAALVEMDMRSLVAAAHVAEAKTREIVRSVGVPGWKASIRALRELSERELRRRIGSLPSGEYFATTWTQWGDQFLETPCRLTVDGGTLAFDFSGSAGQVPFFINSQPYIVLSSFLSWFCPQFLPDLPYNEGVLAPIRIECPEGSIVNATQPAPIGAGHMHVAFNAAESMMQCVRLAAWAAPKPLMGERLSGPNSMCALGMTTWGGLDHHGNPDGWMFMEGSLPGASAGWEHDGVDVNTYTLATIGLDGTDNPPLLADVEIMESLHPILMTYRGLRRGTGGAGRWRSGRGLETHVKVAGTAGVTGQLLGMRGRLPLEGVCGGGVGDVTVFEKISVDGETFVLRLASGGGVGDPLDRDPELVLADTAALVYTPEEAGATYGLVFEPGGLVDHAATHAERHRRRRDRLERATPAVRPMSDKAVRDTAEPTLPLYPGVVQRGCLAVAEESGAVQAPDSWLDGCPTLEEEQPGDGVPVIVRSYLDPLSGRALHTEAVPRGRRGTIGTRPLRWTQAAT